MATRTFCDKCNKEINLATEDCHSVSTYVRYSRERIKAAQVAKERLPYETFYGTFCLPCGSPLTEHLVKAEDNTLGCTQTPPENY